MIKIVNFLVCEFYLNIKKKNWNEIHQNDTFGDLRGFLLLYIFLNVYNKHLVQ